VVRGVLGHVFPIVIQARNHLVLTQERRHKVFIQAAIQVTQANVFLKQTNAIRLSDICILEEGYEERSIPHEFSEYVRGKGQSMRVKHHRVTNHISRHGSSSV
jgi:hypothetical protein